MREEDRRAEVGARHTSQSASGIIITNRRAATACHRSWTSIRARDVPLIQVAAGSPVGLDGSGTAVKSCPEWGRGSHRLPPIMMTLRLAALSS